jgi:hypothetical protein
MSIGDYPRRNRLATIDDARALIQSRLRDLDDEEEKLRGALDHLSGVNGRRRAGMPRGSRSEAQRASSAPGKRRRSRKGGTRSQQALGFIAKHPGSTATEVAKELKIQISYVYKILGDLAKGGELRKEGTAYWPS